MLVTSIYFSSVLIKKLKQRGPNKNSFLDTFCVDFHGMGKQFDLL
jgi:hypothetical protein